MILLGDQQIGEIIWKTNLQQILIFVFIKL